MHEWLTLPELAEMFRVDTRTAGRWCKDGKVPGAIRTPGGHWRISRAEAEKLIKGDQK